MFQADDFYSIGMRSGLALLSRNVRRRERRIGCGGLWLVVVASSNSLSADHALLRFETPSELLCNNNVTKAVVLPQSFGNLDCVSNVTRRHVMSRLPQGCLQQPEMLKVHGC